LYDIYLAYQGKRTYMRKSKNSKNKNIIQKTFKQSWN